MRAHVYVAEVNGRWQARATIQPAVDKLFWMNGGFSEAGRLNEDVADSGWLWREALPLGDACRVVELWERAEGSGGGGKNLKHSGYKADGGESPKYDGYEALERLFACIEEVKREAESVGTASAAGWLRRLSGRRRSRHAVQAGDRLSGMAEHWVRAESRSGQWGAVRAEFEEQRVAERAAYGEQWGAGRAAYSGGQEGAGRAVYDEERVFSDAEIREIAAGAKLAAKLLQGRALLRGEAHALLVDAGGPGFERSWSGTLQLAALLGRVRLSGAVAAGRGGRRCKRCGSGEAAMRRTACAACGRLCAYCAACIGMGRSRECELLITGQQDTKNAGSAVSKRIQLPIEQRLERWKLSPAQTAAAAKALRFVEKHPPEPSQLQKAKMFSLKSVPPIRNFLLWAVTGAGKTEMIFPLVESVLLRGGRALIATPRRDVVIELDPRIRRAFPDSTVVTLYGGSDQRWEAGDITLSTTHQLLRFNEGFDLVIIDELDAFPYHGDPILQYAADKSCAPGAARLLLSATPPNELQRAARSGKLPHARVPVRYHRHPLPVPQLLATPAVAQMLQKRRLPAKLLAALRQSLKRDAQLFIFVQKIVQTEPMAELLRAELRYSDIEATSSQDNERTEKVQRFRAREIRVLVTTTILERGVTIPRSDVYILDAGGRLFDEASLVQMAGRAGRSADDPFGRVYFCSRERNRCQIAAVRHIKTMNRIARKQGYLLPANRGGSPQ